MWSFTPAASAEAADALGTDKSPQITYPRIIHRMLISTRQHTSGPSGNCETAAATFGDAWKTDSPHTGIDANASPWAARDAENPYGFPALISLKQILHGRYM